MHDIVTVHEVACFEHLPDDLFGFKRLNARVIVASLELIKDGPVELLKDEEDAVVLSEDFEKVDDVVMFELLQDSNLTEGCLPDLV